VTRAAIGALVVTIAELAHADPKPLAPAGTATPSEPPPDEIADVESREANLESNEPRAGITVAGALGGGILLGGDIGVGRGPSISLRLGHVATRKTIITFELTGSSGLHKESITGETLTDSNLALLAGAQRYASSSFWVRGAGGLSIFVEDAMPSGGGGKQPIAGIAGLVGAGVDVARWGYLVLGLESFTMASVSRDGLKLQLALGLGLSYY